MSRGARLIVDLSGLVRQLDGIADKGLAAVKVGLYETAGAVAAAIQSEAGTLPFKGETVSQIQSAIGIAKFEDTADGSNTAISVDGYFADSGFPIVYFVREVENGTSRIQANPFMRRAANRVKAQAEAAGNEAAARFIQQYIDKLKED